MSKVTAFIPARGGSKGIPLKNIAPLGGRPLVYWVAKACSACPSVLETFVATDSDEIRDCVDRFSLPRVQTIGRSAASATDGAPTEVALLDFASKHMCEHVALVQPTSPLLTKNDMVRAIETYFTSGADSLLTVVRSKRFVWREQDNWVHPENYDPHRRPRRQDWNGQLVENGALYITNRKRLLESKCRISGRTVAYEMPPETEFEIDQASDLKIVQQLFCERARLDLEITGVARRLELFCVDVDGTLTDGGMYYCESGEKLKRFDTRDAFGMARLRDRGVKLCMISAEDSPIVVSRAKKLGIDHVYVGIEDKEELLARLLSDLQLSWDQVAFVGDDLNDLPSLIRAGFSACPADAAALVAAHVDYVCNARGGRGAVREVCDMIDAARSP